MFLPSLSNRILSRFGLEIVYKKDLDRLIYSSSVNRKIKSLDSSLLPDSFDDQQFLITNKQPVIFDVGSYVGEIACKYAATFPEAAIYAFEPTLSSFHELEKKASEISNIQTFNFAFSDSNTSREFYLNKFSPTNSLLPASSNASKVWGDDLLDTQENIFVECQTIDSFCHDRDISHIDILKLDVQGGELIVLNGARDMLQNNGISLVYTEIIFAETYRNQTGLTDLLQFMDEFQFRLLNFYNPKYLERRLIQADLIFIHGNSLLNN